MLDRLEVRAADRELLSQATPSDGGAGGDRPLLAVRRRARRLELRDRGVYLTCLALAVFSLVVVALIAVYVFEKAWPAFEANGFGFFTNQADPNMDRELAWAFTGNPPGVTYDQLHAFPAIYGTLLTTGGSILLGVPFSILASIFIVELAPRPVSRVSSRSCASSRPSRRSSGGCSGSSSSRRSSATT